MTVLALSLVLLSAITHATWNFFAKRAAGDIAFIWLYMALSVLLYAPLALLLPIFAPLSLSFSIFLLMLASGALHTIYFFYLQRGYRVGELSFVYPLARGTAPLFSTVSAIFVLQEHPTITALLGLLLIVVGLFILTGGTRIFIQGIKAQALLYSICTGLSTAAYGSVRTENTEKLTGFSISRRNLTY